MERRRAEADFIYTKAKPVSDPYNVSPEEHNNRNVSAADREEIAAALRDNQPFTDSAIETEERNLQQINDAIRRMEAGDVRIFCGCRLAFFCFA